MATRKRNKKSPTEICTEILAELRGIHRLRSDLVTPIHAFQPVGGDGQCFYVAFDTKTRMPFTGLKLGGLKELKLPDERITDTALELAKAIWHLKDRLHSYCRATNVSSDIKAVTDNSTELLICADLANQKKHGAAENRSGLSPRLDLVTFDLSNSGPIEFYYNGALKHKEVIVTHTNPIPFTVDILIKDGSHSLGNAATVFTKAFRDWFPTIKSFGILGADNREAEALKDLLFGDSKADP